MIKTKVTKTIFINIGVFTLMIGFLEIGARLFSNTILFGNSKHLFDTSQEKYITNCKSCEAISFGSKIYTDKNGFRVSKENVTSNGYKKNKIIIIGDSVGFGPGVIYKKTFQGLLSKKFDSYEFVNRSVLGHGLEQHLETALRINKNNKENIKKIYLLYCLNDLDNISSTEIMKSSKTISSRSNFNWVLKFKKNYIVSSLNRFLRNRSVLYMYLKGILTNPQERYFYGDLKKYYKDQSTSNLNNIRKIYNLINSKGIEFTVIISPYEYQIREANKNSKLLFPQKIIKEYLKINKINYIDAYYTFKNYTEKSSDLFLPFDPMHLSQKGHDVMFKIISKDLKQNKLVN